MILANFSQCDRETYDAVYLNKTTKIRYAERFFHFICNLKENEYLGFVDSADLMPKSSRGCFKSILKNYTFRTLPDYCKLVY